MKQLLIQYAKYNIWANEQLVKVLLKLSEEQLDTIMVSSFPTLRKTAYHMWSAEYIWIQRLHLVAQPVWVQDSFDGSMQEALNNWTNTSKELLAFIESQYDDDVLNHVVQYYNLKKQSSKLPVYIVLMQLFNHASYHRGQLVTMLRQVGVKKIPQTDFHIFSMKK